MATDAEAGLMLARDEQPNLILMDIQLPRMDGLEATQLLKHNDVTRAIPVIALTALAMKGDEERIRAAGCDDYIAKPMRYQAFLATIAAQLARAATLERKTAVVTEQAALLDRAQDTVLVRQAAEVALEQNRSDPLRFKDEFLSHVSHQLRSPLTAIKQFTTILLSGLAGELNNEQREYQEIVLRNVHKLQSIIDDLPELFSLLETGKLTVEREHVASLEESTTAHIRSEVVHHE